MEEQNVVNKDKKIKLTIITPRGVKVSELVDKLIMRCVDGDMGVLPGHEATSTVLGDGILRFYNNGIEKKLAVFGGIVEINPKEVKIYSTIAQRPEEIDLERAELDRKEAEDAIIERTENLHAKSYNMLLRRSLVRIEVSQFLEDTDNFEEEAEQLS